MCCSQECAAVGIEGKNLAKELVHLQQQLPGLFQDALSDLDSPVITAAIDHYAAFTAYAHSATADAAAPEPSSLLPELHAVKVAHHAYDASSNQPQTANGAETGSAEVLQHDEAASVHSDEGNIQWDMIDAADTASVSQMHEDVGTVEAAGIDWDVVLEPSSSEPPTDSRGS